MAVDCLLDVMRGKRSRQSKTKEPVVVTNAIFSGHIRQAGNGTIRSSTMVNAS
jgi:hypothetical protein